MPVPTTVEDLAELDWKSFESFATTTLRRYYAPHRVDVIKTQFSHDGGRDGEGAYTIGDSSLAIFYRIWIEVKKRSKQNVTLDDIGKNLILASNENDVNKLVVVTNSGYAPQVHKEIERFASRNHMSYALLDGRDLLKIVETTATAHGASVDVSPSGAFPRVEMVAKLAIDVCMSRQPNPIDPLQAGDLVVQHGDPVFLIMSLRRTDQNPEATFTINVEPKVKSVTVMPYADVPRCLGSGDRARVVFAVTRTAAEMSRDTFNIRAGISPEGPVEIDINFTGRCRTSIPVMSTWIPPSRERIIEHWIRQVHEWIRGDRGPMLSFGLMAYPGIGKSLVLNRLRATWLGAGLAEIYVDGALQDRDADIASILFDLVFPLNPEHLRADAVDTVEEWLENSGLDSDRAASIARSLCSRCRFDASLCESKELAELCASLLRRFASRGALILVIEDLHFCQPSAIDLLSSVHKILERTGDARIGFFFTTRQFVDASSAALQTEWWTRVDNFFRSAAIEPTRMGAFDRTEAISILQRTIPTLQEHQAEIVIDQVGCAPLALREAIAYFRTIGVVTRDPAINQMTADPNRLISTIETGVLKKSTISRINSLKNRHPVWLADLLDGAACVGRYFNLETVLPKGWTWDSSQNAALELCEELDIIRPFDSETYMFDHDMIRTTIVEGLTAGRQQRVAAALCQKDAVKAEQAIQGSLLYQAGRYEEAAAVLKARAEIAVSKFRFGDAMKALRLCLTCLDPRMSSKIAPLTDMDVAITHASLPRSRPLLDDTRRAVLDVLLALLRCTGTTTVFTNTVADRLLTEATMLARWFNDKRISAELRMMSGFLHFERDELSESVKDHEEAERLYAEVGAKADDRAANLLRLAITLRQRNQLEASRRMIHNAHRMISKDNRDLLIRLTLNAGASYMDTDLIRVSRYWRSALQMARRESGRELYVHALIDVGYLELLIGNRDEAAVNLSEAYKLAQEFGLDNSLLRGALDLGCLDMVRGDLERARDFLAQAEEIGLRQGIGRRLWRIRANLATVSEILTGMETAYSIDLDLAKQLNPQVQEGNLTKRSALPIINIALRAMQSELHDRILSETLNSDVRMKVINMREQVLANRWEEVSLLARKHFYWIRDRPRFIVTE